MIVLGESVICGEEERKTKKHMPLVKQLVFVALPYVELSLC